MSRTGCDHLAYASVVVGNPPERSSETRRSGQKKPAVAVKMSPQCGSSGLQGALAVRERGLQGGE